MNRIHDPDSHSGICSRENGCEFISSQARQQIAFSDAGAKSISQFRQIEVAYPVPTPVIDLFETIQIDIQKGKPGASLFGFS
jgi:hypothetical protein